MKKCKREAPGFTQTEKGKSDTKAWGVLGDKRQEKRTEPTQLYPHWTLACWRQIQNTQRRNQAELPMRLGLESKENGRSRTYSLTMHTGPACQYIRGDPREK